MPTERDDAGIDQWDRFWAFGSLHSFSQVAGGNYQGVIADFWRERFGMVEPGARIVDVATGNGAIPLLALETADRRGIEIEVHGVDLARIDPVARVSEPALKQALSRCRFHARTPAERLPFEDASVHLVCSQYGLEYSDLPVATREIGRVTAPVGAVALVLHHRDSVLLQAAEHERRQLTFVLDEVRLWVHARNLLRAMAESGGTGKGRNKTKVERKRHRLQEALQQIQHAAHRTPNPRMLVGAPNYVHEILGAVGREPWQKLFDLLEESRQRLLANHQRLLDMQRAALGEHEVNGLVEQLHEQGFRIQQCDLLRDADGGLLGWSLIASRY